MANVVEITLKLLQHFCFDSIATFVNALKTPDNCTEDITKAESLNRYELGI